MTDKLKKISGREWYCCVRAGGSEHTSVTQMKGDIDAHTRVHTHANHGSQKNHTHMQQKIRALIKHAHSGTRSARHEKWNTLSAQVECTHTTTDTHNRHTQQTR
eukprot:GDKI01031693.1.p2 GENE.GDKI01031693.1~~GDKI01031693.1.p2  ORF type:complete len:104 (+),score=33.33 GDKI01031693.1:125-436(+)